MPEDFAKVEDVEKAWRPLSAADKLKVEYWLEVASRRVRRRWPDVDARLALLAGDPRHLDAKDVRDVVVPLVVEVVGGPPVPGATSYAVSAGAESRSVTLATAGGFDPNVFAAWMVAVFEGEQAPAGLPRGSFPKPWEPFVEWRDR